MDPKELKALIKEAREGIKSKNYNETILKCKTIIKKEPRCYNANLYMGTALKELSKYQQSLECYKKAVEIDPNQMYAWQGIILVYEKQGIKNHTDLLDAYKRIATFYEKDDKQKYIESTKKLANVLISQEDTKGALKVITRLAKSLDGTVDLEIAATIVSLLNGTVWNTRTPDQNILYTAALEAIVTESPQPPEETCKKYFTQLNKEEKFDEVINQALAMKDKWNTYHSPMEWLCRYYLEERLCPKVMVDIGGMDTLTDKLFKLYPSSTFGHFAKGKFLVEEGLKMNDGFGFLRTGLESNYNSKALLVLIKGMVVFGDWEGALELCQSSLRFFEKDQNVCKEIRKLQIKGMIGLGGNEMEKKVEELLEIVKDDFVNEEKEEWAMLKASLYWEKMDFDKLKEILKELDQAKGSWILGFYRMIADLESVKDTESLKDAVKGSIELEEPDVDGMLEAAKLLFNLKVFDMAGELFMKITEYPAGLARPLPWKYLGDIYSLQENIELAAKCYKKSYRLCQTGEVGMRLSDCYFTLVQDKSNMEHLLEATKTFAKLKSKWAWLRLGVIYLNKDNANEAVNAFHACIRADINDCHVWESLGDAYCLRGSFQAAINSYNKALSLGADSMYPKFRIGVVYQKLDQFDDSIKAFEELLKEFPNNVPALTEMARTHSRSAQVNASENFDICAQKEVEKALEYSVLAIQHSSKNNLLPWTIIADSPLTLADVAETNPIKVPLFLLGISEAQEGKIQTKEVPIEKFKEIGTKALLECLQIISSKDTITYSKGMKSYVHHQLALSYFHRGLTSKGERKYPDFLQKALVLAKKSVAVDQGNKEYWNTLGVVAYFCDNYELSQHSFIKSVELDGSNAPAWCNLGLLYLKHDKPLLAHKAFAKAQSMQPLYSYCWTGQGLVAEAIAPTEAVDLFRHSAHLEATPFGVSCYADWMCRILLKDVKMTDMDYWYNVYRIDALTLCNDLITRTQRRLPTPHLLNIKGIIAALNGFYQTSLEAFDSALELAASPDNLYRLSDQENNKIVMNKLAVLIKMEKWEEAKEIITVQEELGINGTTMGALVLSKLEDYPRAEALYTQLLNLYEEESDKLDVMICLGILYNVTKGPNGACQVLLQESMVKNPHGLLALSAIGVMNTNAEFLGNVLGHLEQFKDHPDFLPDVGLLKACFYIMTNDPRQGLNVLLKLVHIYPLNVRLWTMLSQVIFSHQSDRIPSSVCRKTVLTALKLASMKGNRTGQTTNKALGGSSATKSAAMISLCHLMENEWKTAKVTALKGIRKYPEERGNWIVLACAYWFQFVEERSIQAYTETIRLLMKEQELQRISKRATIWTSAFLQKISKFHHLVNPAK